MNRWLRWIGGAGTVLVVLGAVIGTGIQVGELSNQLQTLNPEELRVTLQREVKRIREDLDKAAAERGATDSARFDEYGTRVGERLAGLSDEVRELAGMSAERMDQFGSRLSGVETRVEAYKEAYAQLWHGLLGRRWCVYRKHGSRALGNVYRNDTTYPIELAVMVSREQYCNLRVLLTNSVVLERRDADRRAYCAATMTIPPNATYRVEVVPTAEPFDGSAFSWAELRDGDC